MRSARWFLGSVLLIGLTVGIAPLSAEPAKDDPERLQVVYVELAWLADSELCVYYPTAQVENGSLKVAGFLPSAALRDKALKIASLVSRLPISDDIKIHPGCRFMLAKIADDALLQAAAQALKARFPNEYKQWQMGLRASGEILLAGSVDGYEKKLLVSEKLRSLPGCKCVVNRLQVHKVETPPAPKVSAPTWGPAPLPNLPIPTIKIDPMVLPGQYVEPASGTQVAPAFANSQVVGSKSWQTGKSTTVPIPATPAPGGVVVPPTIVQVAATAPVKTATAAPASTAKVAELRALIQKAAGPHLTKLQLNLVGNKLSVRYYAPSSAEAERLADIVMTLPALAPYWLELKVDVPR